MSIKNKLTVIIPTLAVPDAEITNYTLHQLRKAESVKKVFIIDNTQDKVFKKKYAASGADGKIKVITDQPNLYVNPAWNYGISRVDTPYYLLLNDDIMLRGEVLDLMVTFLEENTHINLTTIKTHNFTPLRSPQAYDIDDVIHGFSCKEYTMPPIDKSYPLRGSELEYEFRLLPFRQGWFMAGRTGSWVPIVGRANVMSGDDWIYEKNAEQGYEGACFVSNCRIYHAESSTVNIKSHSTNELPHPERK